MTAAARPPERGVILVNVLVALAIGAAMVTLMISSQDAGIERARRAAAGARAEALALGAEASVVVALRRDLAESPGSDSLAEPWAQAAQAAVELGTGRFAVALRDLQAGLDLNALGGDGVGGGVAGAEALGRLVAALGLAPETAATLIDSVRARGPLRGLGEVPGLDAEARARLAPHLAFHPAPAAVNLNSAGVEVMGAVLRNRAAARRLMALRERQGSLGPADLAELGLVPTAAAGFTSDAWEARVLAEVDGVAVRLTSRLQRQRLSGEVVVAGRRFGAGPPEAPPPP